MMDIDLRQTLILAILVLYAGKWLTAKLAPLRELNIPEPITGGLLAAVLFTLAHLLFDVTFEFALQIRDALLLVFFTIIGLSTKISTLIAGGKNLAIFLVAVIGFLFIQNTVGILVVMAQGYIPQVGILGGSISLSGGHGTTIAWAPVFAQNYGIASAMEIGIAFATFGLVIGGTLGGPIARFLIRRHQLETTSTESLEVGFKYDQEEEQIGADHMLSSMLTIAIAIGLGMQLNYIVGEMGLKMPLFVTCLFSGIVLTNLIPIVFPKLESPAGTPVLSLLSELSLGLFLAISLMSLQLWTLAEYLAPILLVVLAQVVAVILYVVFVVFPIMGKTYDAAVVSSGFTGLCLGATPTAIANMAAVSKHYGAAPLAFSIVPLVGAFFIDISNSIVIEMLLKFVDHWL
jgi:ESS family glutamate:Na+ symporter